MRANTITNIRAGRNGDLDASATTHTIVHVIAKKMKRWFRVDGSHKPIANARIGTAAGRNC